MKNLTYTAAVNYAIALASNEEFEMEFTADEYIAKLEALKGQLEKRNSGERKPTKTQVENEDIKNNILTSLTDEGMQCKDIAENFGITGQKASALLKQLVEAGLVEKYTEKRVTYFKRAAEE